MKKTSEAQLKANQNWIENNRERSNYTRSKSSAKSFIRNKATLKDLENLEILIKERRDNLLG
ncbi:hypothetical protein [Clostridium sp.]|uniref:hypothetical protein n=1 Tax=Clostridium sp. TaxID=1506 RepID=UPI0025C2E4ED|nr:hypothetical protein [Clostridium sp.]